MSAIFIYTRQPGSHTRVRLRLHPLGYDMRIQQEAHKSTFRGLPDRRLIFTPELRRGEEAKNSARFPLRLVFRSHSSAATTTTTIRPFRVIVCGPSDVARSITSLNFALASATVHACVLTRSSLRVVTQVIIVISGADSQYFFHPVAWDSKDHARALEREVRGGPKTPYSAVPCCCNLACHFSHPSGASDASQRIACASSISFAGSVTGTNSRATKSNSLFVVIPKRTFPTIKCQPG